MEFVEVSRDVCVQLLSGGVPVGDIYAPDRHRFAERGCQADGHQVSL